MARHWDREVVPFRVLANVNSGLDDIQVTHNAWEYLLQSVCGTDRFDLSTIQAIFELEERLPDWVGE